MGDMETISGPSYFRTTAWSVVAGAQDDANTNREQCLSHLCNTYWKPVYQYIRRRGISHDDARDLTQDYFATFLEKNFVATADKERGRFRTFVLVTVNRFVSKQLTKRSHRDAHLNIVLSGNSEGNDEYLLPELAINETAEDDFNRRWALSLIETTLARMKAECTKGKKKNYYEALALYLDSVGGERNISYRDMAAQLGISEGDITNYLFRGRNIFQKLLRDEIRQSVTTESAIDEEIEALKEYLRD